jgi:hypothetical protein
MCTNGGVNYLTSGTTKLLGGFQRDATERYFEAAMAAGYVNLLVPSLGK